MLEGVDVSWVQGNYHPGSEDFVIVNASRANVGLAVGSAYRQQVANARAAGKHVGHYFFNGNIDPVRCADFFVSNLSYEAGDSLWLDCESESGTGTAAWTPAQAAAFNARVMSHGLPCPGTYLNRSLMDGFDWSPVVKQGAPLWIAYYNPAPPPIKWWPTWTVWQYTSTPMDRNKAQGAMVAASATTTRRKDTELICIRSAAGIDYLVGPNFIFSSPDNNWTQAMHNLYGDPVLAADGNWLNMYLWMHGIPGSALAKVNGNKANGTPYGRAWTPATDVFDAMTGADYTLANVVAVAKAAATTVPAQVVSAAPIDLAAVAKAVNDDAAKRLAS